MTDTVRTDRDGEVLVVTIDRPEVRNAVDGPTSLALADAFRAFDADDELAVAVLTGANGTFCAGADLKAVADGPATRVRRAGDGPMGPTYMLLSKPVIAAVEGHAVAGGLELAVWCDLRVAATDAVFGVYCRRWGVPLIDGGTVRLPRLIGHSHALDMILTGRGVSGDEARSMGLANRLVEPGQALPAAVALAREIASFPPLCMRSDRESSYEQWSMSLAEALVNERHLGLDVIRSGETQEGAKRFVAGAGRHGSFEQPASGPAAYVPPGSVPPMTAPATTPLVAPATDVEPDPEPSH
ncbi:MAG TPA: crotonase/enoyl-CoA hydratase family protein [Acidimicrobiales bacterium]|nr:crotonase/enoyl-CoA hydratase family protein [Acidimicrobiales bacterium]